MGYTTNFNGVLTFTNELTAKQIAGLNKICGEDCRDHPEWKVPHLYYIDVELTDDFDGLRWNGSENSYDFVDQINLIIRLMQQKWPEFGLQGTITAQGEDYDDRWVLIIQDGWAKKVKTEITGKRVKCPHCEEDFIMEDDMLVDL